jgi:hypothetical protein
MISCLQPCDGAADHLCLELPFKGDPMPKFRLTIDTDGEIVCSWILNILSDGLPVERVCDSVARLQNTWEVLDPLVAPNLGLPHARLT